MNRSPRAILGLPEHASLPECKRAYRRLVTRLHPDVNPDPRAHARCNEVVGAWMYLSGRWNQPSVSSAAPPPSSYYPRTSTAMARPMSSYTPAPTQVVRRRTPVSEHYWREQAELEAMYSHLGRWGRDGMLHYSLHDLRRW